MHAVLPFEPEYITIGKSRYGGHYWSRVGTQGSVLESSTARAIEDAAFESDALDDIVCNPGKKLYGVNPCHIPNVYLYGIRRSEEGIYIMLYTIKVCTILAAYTKHV